MAKDDVNKIFDTFAWLIYKEVEKYVNENEAAYNAWVQENAKNKSNAEKRCDKQKDGDT